MGWFNQVGVHATLEKLYVEKTAIIDGLRSEDWNIMADYKRKTGESNEVTRMMDAIT